MNDIKPYFDGEFEAFSFKDVLFIQKYTKTSIEYIERKVKDRLGIIQKKEVRTGDIAGILIVFKESVPCEYPYEDQWDNACWIDAENGEAERFLNEWKSYIESRDQPLKM